jgi:hypothetical protein
MSNRTSNSKSLDYIANRIAFEGSNLAGYLWPLCDDFTPSLGRLSADYLNDLRGAEYVVYSYGTPIAWFKNGDWNIPAIKYSVTTSKHQNYVRRAVA